MLCGTGAHGVYHAGVLRAFHEAGVKIDVMAGQGVGAASAALAAIDGGSRLWEEGGIWRSSQASSLYQWKWPLKAVGWCMAILCVASLTVALWPDPVPAILRWLPLASLLATVGVVAAGASAARLGAAAKRRVEGPWWWRVAGAPLDAERAKQVILQAFWELTRPGDPAARTDPSRAGQRYAEVLAESAGQPGVRELVVIATDVDARRDIVAALVRDPFRGNFLADRESADLGADVLDLAGRGREHALDVIAGALSPPACDPHLVTFGVDSFWRGETHRLCSRTGSVSRLLEELAAAGVSQAVIVSAVAVPSEPHRLPVPRLDFRHRLGDALAAGESAALRDGMAIARLRFDSIYTIAPAHNAIGPFDFAGAYDDASDRRQELLELMERGYQDAYHQFIDPVVGASGEHLQSSKFNLQSNRPIVD